LQSLLFCKYRKNAERQLFAAVPHFSLIHRRFVGSAVVVISRFKISGGFVRVRLIQK
jgi:hypothetical protein